MDRNLGLILLFFAILPSIVFLTISSIDEQQATMSIPYDQKFILIDYSYNILDNYYYNNTLNFDKDKFDTDLVYDRLFITFIHNGTIRGCHKGASELKGKDRVFEDIEMATIKNIEDKRFGGRLNISEHPNVDLVFTFLFNMEKLEYNDLNYLKNQIELGIDAIEIRNGNTVSFFKDSVPITKNYDLEYTLERLSLKGNLEADGYKNESTQIYKYDTYTFIGNRGKSITDLYRYNIVIDVNQINNKVILDKILSGKDWFLKTINPELTLLEYQYDPSENQYSSDNNHVRQLGTLWAISELKQFLNTNEFDPLINNTLTHYLSYSTTVDDYTFLTINGKSKLAYNAFFILALLNYQDYLNRDIILSQLADGILSMQNENGSYDTYFMSDINTGTDFYPGQAMLALIKLYEHTNNNEYIDSVKNAFPYYRSYWRDNKNTAFIPWHTQVYSLLFNYTNDPDLIDFIFEMNDWLIDNHQIFNSQYPDEIGGLPYNTPMISTSSYLEGINDAYTLAKNVNDAYHMEKYANSIMLGTRFILQLQFNENNTFYLENPNKAIGGFKKSLICNELRIDHTQHAVMALMKAFSNNIFN